TTTTSIRRRRRDGASSDGLTTNRKSMSGRRHRRARNRRAGPVLWTRRERTFDDETRNTFGIVDRADDLRLHRLRGGGRRSAAKCGAEPGADADGARLYRDPATRLELPIRSRREHR